MWKIHIAFYVGNTDICNTPKIVHKYSECEDDSENGKSLSPLDYFCNCFLRISIIVTKILSIQIYMDCSYLSGYG